MLVLIDWIDSTMNNLSDIAQLTRRVLLWTAIGIFSLIILWLLYQAGILLYRYLNPPVEKYNNKYGDKLPPIKLPDQKLVFSKFKPVLDTPNSTPPAFPKFFNVYKMAANPASLLGVTRSEDVAKAFEIASRGAALADNNVGYTNINKIGLNETLTVNPRSFNFTYKTNYRSANLKLEKALPGPEEVSVTAKSLLNTYRIGKTDLINSQANVSYFLLQDGLEARVSSGSEANVAKVNFGRGVIQIQTIEEKINQDGNKEQVTITKEYPIVNSERNGLVNLTFGRIKPSLQSEQLSTVLLEMNYTYQEIERDISREKEDPPANYPILTGDEAWAKFINGESTLIIPTQIDFNNFTGVEVKDISLAFYDASTEQPFLQPIFVFGGEGLLAGNRRSNFTAYLPAIRPEIVENTENKETTPTATPTTALGTGSARPKTSSPTATPKPNLLGTPSANPSAQPTSASGIF